MLALFILRGVTQAACNPASADNHWGLERHNGVAWLMTPCGDRFFSIGINGVAPSVEGLSEITSAASEPDGETSWNAQATAQMKLWGFNTAGSFSSPALPFPAIPELDLGWKSGFLWADPFAPAVALKMMAAARSAVAPYKRSGKRIGYFSDNEIGWCNATLFLYYIERPSSNYTKRELVHLLRHYYQDDWRRFASDFVTSPNVTDFHDLLESTARIRMRPDGTGIQVIRRWTGVLTGHYYKLVHDALRAADPDALIFGDRLPGYYDPDAVRAMAPYVDAIASNYNVDSPDGWIAHYYFDALRQLSGNKPVLISEWYFSAKENRSRNTNNGYLMTVQTQDARARGAASAARHFALDPSIVGIHWFQYYDEPSGGRPLDGEDYNFGLVDTGGVPYQRVVSALGLANRGLSEIHRGSTAVARRRQTEIVLPNATIDVTKADLTQWPKDEALISGFKAPANDGVFGDFFLAWSEQGLHLATISMDYFDGAILSYDNTFPLKDAFRVDLGIDAGTGPRKFALFVVPARHAAKRQNLKMHIELCRIEGAKCIALPSVPTGYFPTDGARIFAQLTLPWSALGIDGPPVGKEIRLQLAATAFFRSRWMSLNGEAPSSAMRDVAHWRTVRLGTRTHPFERVASAQPSH